jgi:CheY-like chemotaxis protein
MRARTLPYRHFSHTHLKLRTRYHQTSLEAPQTSMHLLIVDNNPSHCTTLAGQLKLYDIQSHEACNGIEALQRVGEHPYDAILLDWVMPELDGFHTLTQLRQMPNHRHLPVIVITACETDDIQILAMHAGADAFMTKPVDLDRLLSLIDGLMEGNRRIA